jgi:peptidoglycan/LPS O-acetylase OafA/YrhL
MSKSVRAEFTNNYDFLRIVAASMVVIGHAYYLKGSDSPIPSIAYVPIHELAVMIFFSVSGFLVTRSADTSSSFVSFYTKRVFRIFPGLVLVVLLSALVLGPLMTNLGREPYFQNQNWSLYLANISLYPVYSLPGVFTELPYANAVNGSLWTLPVEFFSYTFGAVVLLALKKCQRLAFFLITLSFLIIGWIFHQNDLRYVVYGSEIGDSLALAAYFFSGGFVYFLRKRNPQVIRLDVASVLLFTAILIAQTPGGGAIGTLALTFSIPFFVVALGESSTPALRSFGRFGDPSYGLYLWAFPVQQIVMSTNLANLSFEANVGIVLVVSTLAGYLSWHLLEKRFVQLSRSMFTRTRTTEQANRRTANE